MTLPLRLPPLVEITVTVAVPEPLPDPLTVAHDVLPLDVQLHPVVVETVTVAVPPDDVKLSDVGVTV